LGRAVRVAWLNEIILKLKQPSTVLLVISIALSFVPGLLVVLYFKATLFTSLDTMHLLLLSVVYTAALYSAIFTAYSYLNIGDWIKMSDDVFKLRLGLMALVNLFYCCALTTAVIGFMYLFHSRSMGVFIASFGAFLLLETSFQALFTKYPKKIKAAGVIVGLLTSAALIYLAKG